MDEIGLDILVEDGITSTYGLGETQVVEWWS